MSERVHPVTFRNAQGLQLVGLVHEPLDHPRRDVAIVLLSPGVKTRVAPHRLYRKLAATLTRQGFFVFRFDFYGLGDAEGEIGLRNLRDLYGSVAVGRYVGDTRDAIAWFTTTYGIGRVVTGGLCGGALTALLEAPGDPRVAGILAIGLPVLLDSADVDPRQYMTVGQLNSLRGRYFQKMLNPRAWLRLLTFRSDYRLLLRALLVRLKGGRGRAAAAPAVRAAPAAGPPAGPAPAAAGDAAPNQPGGAGDAASNVNPHFAPALFRTLEQRCPMLLLFSGADRLYWEFEEKFLAVHQEAFAAQKALVNLHVIASANHVLTFESWQHEAQDAIQAWLTDRFPAPLVTADARTQPPRRSVHAAPAAGA